MPASFHPPAIWMSWVLAPRAVSSTASPTRPLCEVLRPSSPAAAQAAANRRLIWWTARPMIGLGRRRRRRGVQSADRGGAAADQPPDVGPVAGRVRLRAAHGDDDVVVTGQVDVGPAQGGHFAAAQGAVKQQRDDRPVDQAAAHCGLLALEAAAGASSSAAGGEDGVALFGGEAARQAAVGRGSCGRGGSAEALEGLPGQRTVRRVLVGVVGGAADGGDHESGGRRRAAGLVQAPEIRGQAPVVERPAVEPGAEPSERAGVGVAGVRGDGLLDESGGGLGAVAVRVDERGGRPGLHHRCDYGAFQCPDVIP